MMMQKMKMQWKPYVSASYRKSNCLKAKSHTCAVSTRPSLDAHYHGRHSWFLTIPLRTSLKYKNSFHQLGHGKVTLHRKNLTYLSFIKKYVERGDLFLLLLCFLHHSSLAYHEWCQFYPSESTSSCRSFLCYDLDQLHLMLTFQFADVASSSTSRPQCHAMSSSSPWFSCIWPGDWLGMWTGSTGTCVRAGLALKFPTRFAAQCRPHWLPACSDEEEPVRPSQRSVVYLPSVVSVASPLLSHIHAPESKQGGSPASIINKQSNIVPDTGLPSTEKEHLHKHLAEQHG